MSTKITHKPDYAFHPGETLAETLESLGMTQKELAERAGRPLKTINEIIQGKAAITADTAIQLERVTGVPASFWNNSQRNYEAVLAQQAETTALEKELAWLKKFPWKSLCALGWITRFDDPIEQLRAVLNYFGVAGVAEWASLWGKPAVAFRKSRAFDSNPMAVAAWLREGELQARHIEAAPFDKAKFLSALAEIRNLTNEDPDVFVPKMTDLCAAAGVAVVFVPEVPGTRAYGATRWLTSDKAVIQLSLRGKSDDFLWFTFFHEAAHILKHGKKDVFIESKDGSKDAAIRKKEVEADAFSADFLIPADDYAGLLKTKIHSAPGVFRVAKKLGISPGIVVGRLQHDKAITFAQMNHLKKRFAITVTLN